MSSSSSSSPDHASRRPAPRSAPRTTPRAALLAAGAAAALALGACTADDDNAAADPTTYGSTTAVEDGTGAGARSGSGSATGSGPGAAPAYSRYVALGDSFAAFGPVDAPTTGPSRCYRSTRNYPALVADRLGGAPSGDVASARPGGPAAVEFVDATCGGARSRDMIGAQRPDIPAQFAALTADTDLVTLSIGGNDIGFGDIAGCVTNTRADTGAPCRDRLEALVEDALGALPDALDAVYARIDELTPEARVVTTGYMPLVPAHGGCGFVSAMAPGDVTWTRQVTERINLLVADAAERARAEPVMPVDAADHHACAPAGERYTDFTGAGTGSHPMHPTAEGQAAMADAVTAVL
ncbi:SGNH/GDSL hydrolase family protein [Dietzia aurantiaca]|uniref:SGNH/GDSL hydrolase family protein n=1 Tax=Dietzia aurantiaca TaxID=983873 RepID=UPI001E2F0998|nr:SGNH/GDSL hydrolase family protein [Dietzia aurantiaca]MCD2261104.1 SGNH/GDSL hydrolase family protein [Dietzia aurantiaca]